MPRHIKRIPLVPAIVDCRKLPNWSTALALHKPLFAIRANSVITRNAHVVLPKAAGSKPRRVAFCYSVISYVATSFRSRPWYPSRLHRTSTCVPPPYVAVRTEWYFEKTRFAAATTSATVPDTGIPGASLGVVDFTFVSDVVIFLLPFVVFVSPLTPILASVVLVSTTIIDNPERFLKIFPPERTQGITMRCSRMLNLLRFHVQTFLFASAERRR